jgi:hypothetical protein
MSCYLDHELIAASTDHRAFSWRSLFSAAIDRVRTRYRQRRDREELNAYLASDHRASADIGVSNYHGRDRSGLIF